MSYFFLDGGFLLLILEAWTGSILPNYLGFSFSSLSFSVTSAASFNSVIVPVCTVSSIAFSAAWGWGIGRKESYKLLFSSI